MLVTSPLSSLYPGCLPRTGPSRFRFPPSLETSSAPLGWLWVHPGVCEAVASESSREMT